MSHNKRASFRMRRQSSNRSSSTSSDILVAPGPSNSPTSSGAIATESIPRASSRHSIHKLPVKKEDEAAAAAAAAAKPHQATSESLQNEKSTSVVMRGLRMQINFKSQRLRDAFGDMMSRPPRPESTLSTQGLFNDATTRRPNRRGIQNRNKHLDTDRTPRGQTRHLANSDNKSSASAVSPRPTRNTSNAIPNVENEHGDTNSAGRSKNMRTRSSRQVKAPAPPITGSRRSSRLTDAAQHKYNRPNWGVDSGDDEDGTSRSTDEAQNEYPDWGADVESNDGEDGTSRPIDAAQYGEGKAGWDAYSNGDRDGVDADSNVEDGDHDPDADADVDDDDDDEGDENEEDEAVSHHSTTPMEDKQIDAPGSHPRGSNLDRRIRTPSPQSGNWPSPVDHRSTRPTARPKKGTSIRADDFPKYPGVKFWHVGNGWYRAGEVPKGRRPTMFVSVTENGKVIQSRTRFEDVQQEETLVEPEPEPELDVRPEEEEKVDQHVEEVDEEAELLEEGIVEADSDGSDSYTVSQAYTLHHPETDWIYRGNGRYAPSRTPKTSLASRPTMERRSSRANELLSRELEAKSPIEESRGRPRFKRVVSDIEEDDDVLYDKNYVDSHPLEIFHHRGQGRYARGPRLKPTPSTQETQDHDSDGLVDSTYVNSHPNETFHHRGQGKWARGLPPPGSSNKVAVRGPGAKDKIEITKTGEEEEEEEDGEDSDGPPDRDQLVLKKDGPDRWPLLSWYYRGGGKWARTTKLQEETVKKPVIGIRKPRNTFAARGRNIRPEAQLHRETLAAGIPVTHKAASVRRSRGGGPTRLVRKPSDMHDGRIHDAMRSKGSSDSQSKAPTPRPALLTFDQDRLTNDDLPSLYKEDWSSGSDSEMNDLAGRLFREMFQPMNHYDMFVRPLQKFDPAVRSIESLKLLASNAQSALEQIQQEYLELDKKVAQNPMPGKKERKPVKGGRVPVETVVFEDRKEAILYDYTYDARKIGYQDPDAQRIVRDAEGRELRRRRNRDVGAALDHWGAPDPNSEEMSAKRAIKPVSRFDGVVVPPQRKRTRLTSPSAPVDSAMADAQVDDFQPSTARHTRTTDAANLASAEEYKAPTRGRWKHHVPKRIRELRGESVASNRSSESSTTTATTPADPPSTAIPQNDPVPAPEISAPATPIPAVAQTAPPSTRATSPKPSVSPLGGVRKGRPPGSKNLHKRKDAGIKKGPRKPKILPPAPPSMDLPSVPSATSSSSFSAATAAAAAASSRTFNLLPPHSSSSSSPASSSSTTAIAADRFPGKLLNSDEDSHMNNNGSSSLNGNDVDIEDDRFTRGGASSPASLLPSALVGGGGDDGRANDDPVVAGGPRSSARLPAPALPFGKTSTTAAAAATTNFRGLRGGFTS